MPPEVTTALASAQDHALDDAQPLLAVPEYTTDLPGGERPSQTDVLVLGRARGGAFAMAVEGKVAESFGPTLSEWLREASDGKRFRWAFLCATLGLEDEQSSDLRYQLFHRTASAVLTARRHHAPLAIALIHSFHPDRPGMADFGRFLSLFGAAAAPGIVAPVATLGGTRRYAGWADGDLRFTKV